MQYNQRKKRVHFQNYPLIEANVFNPLYQAYIYSDVADGNNVRPTFFRILFHDTVVFCAHAKPLVYVAEYYAAISCLLTVEQ